MEIKKNDAKTKIAEKVQKEEDIIETSSKLANVILKQIDYTTMHNITTEYIKNFDNKMSLSDTNTILGALYSMGESAAYDSTSSKPPIGVRVEELSPKMKLDLQNLDVTADKQAKMAFAKGDKEEAATLALIRDSVRNPLVRVTDVNKGTQVDHQIVFDPTKVAEGKTSFKQAAKNYFQQKGMERSKAGDKDDGYHINYEM